METAETMAEGPLPPWLEPDNPESIPPAALRELYGELPLGVGQELERVRKTMRDGYMQGLKLMRDSLKQGVLAAHAALAGQEKVSFKDWVLAAGINYNTAESIVRRAEADKRRAMHVDSLLSDLDEDEDEDDDHEDDHEDEDEDSDEKGDEEEESDDDDSDDEEQEGEDEHEEKEKEKDKPKPNPKPNPKPKEPQLLFKFDTAEEQQRASVSIERVMEAQKLPTREAALLHVLAVYDQIWSVVAEDSAVWAFVAEDGEEEVA